MNDLDNPLVATPFPPAYYLHMEGKSIQQRINDAMKKQGMSKAELSRRSDVPYHALDKFLKRDGATTSAENAQSLLSALGLPSDPDGDYEELRQIYFSLSLEKRRFALAAIRGLLSEDNQ